MRSARRGGPLAAAGLALAAAAVTLPFLACDGERTAIVQGPPLTIEAADAAPTVALQEDASAPAPDGPPITATFVDLTMKGMTAQVRPCEYVVLAVARGRADSPGGALAVGDYLVAHGKGPLDAKGEGIALLAAVRDATCGGGAAAAPTFRVVRATEAPELAWAGGTLRAHLDVLEPLGGVAYVGRLEGTAPVAEHVHDTSWEVLATIEGSGTMRIAGRAVRVGPRSVVTIPPATPHAWSPDDGARLVALQFYGPPGPEQRFKALAAGDTTDGGLASADASTAAATSRGEKVHVDKVRPDGAPHAPVHHGPSAKDGGAPPPP